LGLASILIKKKDRNAVIIATPADHIITQEKRFLQLLKSATCHARDTNMFVTFGIPPSSPDTGYGYIEIRNKKQRGGAYRVKRFVEKPSLRKAKQYVLSKHFFWNSGIFVFHVQTLLEAIESHMPHLYDGLMKIEKAMGTSQEKAVIHKVYHSIKSVSIDYGIMEKINNVLLMKAHIGWNDVGNWSSLDAIKEKDSKGNIVHGSCVMLNSENNIINAHDKLIALIGIKDSIVVQTDTVVLVANKKDAQDVKRIVEKLERQNKNDYL
ncbi:MAG: sugar phosphate nucleotidyltransferase, partial [Candidatus Omnitrophota bacterium]